VVDPYLFPARGRKPLFCTGSPIHGALGRLIPTFSPQGDGNKMYRARLRPTSLRYIVDPYLFPARGRKHLQVTKFRIFDCFVDPYLFPARGRKPGYNPAPSSPFDRLIPTFSPQGDGNSAGTITSPGFKSLR